MLNVVVSLIAIKEPVGSTAAEVMLRPLLSGVRLSGRRGTKPIDMAPHRDTRPSNPSIVCAQIG